MKTKSLRSTVELVLIVAVALFFALTIQALAVKPYRIPSESMLPTLKPGQRILVDRFSHRARRRPEARRRDRLPPAARRGHRRLRPRRRRPVLRGRRGDAPLVRDARRPTHSDTTFVKRVVGLPGDTIAIVNGHVIRNGKPRQRAVRVLAAQAPSAT